MSTRQTPSTILFGGETNCVSMHAFSLYGSRWPAPKFKFANLERNSDPRMRLGPFSPEPKALANWASSVNSCPFAPPAFMATYAESELIHGLHGVMDLHACSSIVGHEMLSPLLVAAFANCCTTIKISRADCPCLTSVFSADCANSTRPGQMYGPCQWIMRYFKPAFNASANAGRPMLSFSGHRFPA